MYKKSGFLEKTAFSYITSPDHTKNLKIQVPDS